MTRNQQFLVFVLSVPLVLMSIGGIVSLLDGAPPAAPPKPFEPVRWCFYNNGDHAERREYDAADHYRIVERGPFLESFPKYGAIGCAPMPKPKQESQQ